MATALHPQTILALDYGTARLKLRVSSKLGFKNSKYIAALYVTSDNPGGYWEDQGYNSFSGSSLVGPRAGGQDRAAARPPRPVWSWTLQQAGRMKAVDTGLDGASGASAGEARLAALMAAAQDGDGAAYATLLRACLPLIQSVVRGQGVPADRVDDAVQDVMLTVHRARHTYDPDRPFTPWLRAIAQRRAIDALRGQGRQRAREVHAPVAYESHPDPGASAGQVLEQADRADHLRAVVAGLPEGQREAVELLALQERTLDEAATRTGRSKGALKVNLHRALKTLRARLKKDDLGREEGGDV